MMIDPLRDGYTLTELTDAINVIPNSYGRLRQLGLFKDKGIRGPTFTIESRDGTLRLMKTMPWGSTPVKVQTKGRATKAFAVPHTPGEGYVPASEVVGVRKFGSENELETVNDRVLDELETIRGNLEQTMEYRQMQALTAQQLLKTTLQLSALRRLLSIFS
jgi:hypothetical protein